VCVCVCVCVGVCVCECFWKGGVSGRSYLFCKYFDVRMR
jgi:hypothetical protein